MKIRVASSWWLRTQWFFQNLAYERWQEDQEQEDPSQPRPAPRFNEGEAAAGSSDAPGAIDAQGHPITMSDEEGGAGRRARRLPDPVTCLLGVPQSQLATLEEETRLQNVTAFDETVWASIDDQRQLSTCELQAAVDAASKANRKPKKKRQKPMLSRMLTLIV